MDVHESHAPDSPIDENRMKLIDVAADAFRRDLPQLLKQKPGKWVGYHGAEVIDFGDEKSELFGRMLQRFRRDEILVTRIEPDPGPLYVTW
jgi:hypothetical protein